MHESRSAQKRALDWRDPVHLLAFGFGAGTSPLAPGTLGTLVAIPLFLVLQGLSLIAYLVITAILFLVGIWICDKTSRDLGAQDPGGIVWDEIVGYLITMISAPAGWGWVVAGFLFFRFFDILKPWPIRLIDRRIKGGIGIMLDDALAGLFGLLAVQALRVADVGALF